MSITKPKWRYSVSLCFIWFFFQPGLELSVCLQQNQSVPWAAGSLPA